MSRAVSISLQMIFVKIVSIAGSTAGLAPFAAAQVDPAPASKGGSAVDATFTDAAGKPVKLSDYRGKSALVLLFMRGFKGDSACFHCNNQMRAVKADYARLHEAGAEVLAVLPGATDVKGFLAKVGTSDDKSPDPNFSVPFPVVLDTNFAACRTFGVAYDPSPDAFPFPVSEPATIVLGKDGRVVFSYHGTEPPDRPTVETILDVLAHGSSRGSVKPPERAAPPPPPPSKLPWRSYADGMALARTDGRPILLDFHALW
jgi:peroxiredoxin